MKYAFIQKHQSDFEVKIMCRVLGVTRSGYYAWLSRPISEREKANQALAGEIQAAHRRSRGTYGAPRIHAELKTQGIHCGRKRVARLMRLHGIQARQHRRYKVTTHSQHAYPVAPNVLQRQFTAERPNQKWLTDITYVKTREGWLYLAAVLDVYSRTIVGWAMDQSMDHHLVSQALEMAISRRHPGTGLLHHSDRGSQYAAGAYRRLLKAHGITVSMSGTGNCYDNAMMESFFATLKAECAIWTYDTRAAARRSIFEYIEVWYNRQRLHSALGYLSPEAYEQAYYRVFLVSTKTG